MSCAIEYGNFGGSITSVSNKSRSTINLEREQNPASSTCVFGYATRYLKPHIYDGKIDVFTRGAFARSLMGNRTQRFLIDHDECQLLGTTADRLELMGDDCGIAFRFSLTSGNSRRDLAAIGARRGMSIGYGVVGAETKTIEGEHVRIIHDAELAEVSAVSAGAVPDAFLCLGDGTEARTLHELSKSGAIMSASHARSSDKAFERLMGQMRNLNTMQAR